MKYALALALALLCVSDAEARPRRGRVYLSPQTYSYASQVSHGSDQERCQHEADYMAAHGITGHVGGTIGGFEGVGYGGSPNCNTCTPGGGMSLTGDASAQGPNGMWYRVRSWR